MLNIANNLKLPNAILEQHMAVLGKTRSGKSSVLRLLVESLLDRNERACIIDPKGDWFGLRSSADGKKAGYSVMIFGGPRADLPLNQHAGAKVAELVAGGNRPCIIDLGGWMVGERTRFFIDFASTLFRSIDAPLHLVIDEVHNFAPQGKVLDVDAGKMLHWANRLGSEGAGKGLVILSASQRPQKVHKDFLTCAETLVAMRVIHKLDRDAVKDWIDGAGDPAKGKEVLNTLATMARGEGWVWSPEAQFGPERVKFPLFKTYDSFAAPTAGKWKAPLKGWADVDIDAEKERLAAIEQEAKANDPAELKKRIRELEKQLESKAPVIDQKATEQAISMAIAARDEHWKAEIAKLQTSHSAIVKRMCTAKGIAENLVQLVTLNGEASVEVTAPPVVHKPVYNLRPKSQTVPQPPRRAPVVTDDDKPLGKCERAVLQAMYWLRHEEATPAKVAFYSGYSASSSGFTNALGRLRSLGLLRGWSITPEGEAIAAPAAGEKPNGSELREWLRRRLGRAENTLLDVMIEAGGRRMTNEELSELSGYSISSSGFTNALGKLRTLEAAEGYERDGGTKASEVLLG